MLELEGQAVIGGRALFPPLGLRVETGAWTSLLGPSGVGKSTLLRALAGLPFGGVWEGALRGTMPVALMAQDAGLLPWLDIRQNASLGARLRGEPVEADRLDAILEQTGLLEHAHKRPSALSGGQRQRVALARVLMEDRPLVLLDEPFSALDAAMRLRMQDLAARLLAGRSVVMVTHDPSEAARLSDRIYMLTAQGLDEVACPSGGRPRGAMEPEVLRCQQALLERLLALDSAA